MNEDPGTTVGQTAPPARRGRPPKVDIAAASEALRIEEMPKAKPQCQADRESHKLIGELRESLEPFAKLPFEQDSPLEKVLYSINRGVTAVDITNGNIIRAKTVLGMM